MNPRLMLVLLLARLCYSAVISDSQTVGLDPLIVAYANAEIAADLRVQTSLNIRNRGSDVPYKRGSGVYEFSLWVLTDGPVRPGSMLLGAKCGNDGNLSDQFSANIAYRDSKGEHQLCLAATMAASGPWNEQIPITLGEPVQFVFRHYVSGISAGSDAFLLLQKILEPNSDCQNCFSSVPFRVQQTLPEPGSIFLISSGLGLLIWGNQRRRQRRL